MKKTLAVLVGLMLMVTVFAMAQAAPDVVDLKGAALGAVKFNHKAHTAGGFKCDVCHHASKPEKANTSKFQSCRACHSKAAAAPMKTKVAFHAVGAKTGVCIDCHLQEKKGPTKCSECHKKA